MATTSDKQPDPKALLKKVELLMPGSFVRAAIRQYGLGVERLAALFRVSQRAMQIRLEELGF
jgi:hypothetical protein